MNETRTAPTDKSHEGIQQSNQDLTPQQIENWKFAFPELRFLSDEQIQRFRDNIQNGFNTDKK